MAATLVQSATNTGTTAAVTVGSGQGWVAPTAGNLLVAWANSDATVTVSNSMTAATSVVDGNAAYFWYKIAAVTDTAVTFTPSAGVTSTNAGLLEYSGVVGATPLDAFGTPSSIVGTAGSSTTAVSVTGTNAVGDLFLALAALHNGTTATSPVWASSFVNEQSVAVGTIVSFLADFQNTAAAAVSTSCSWTNNMLDRQELLMAFKLAAGAAPALIPTLVMPRSA